MDTIDVMRDTGGAIWAGVPTATGLLCVLRAPFPNYACEVGFTVRYMVVRPRVARASDYFEDPFERIVTVYRVVKVSERHLWLRKVDE